VPFRRSFDCLWCGRDWQVRADDDLEGWAALCPDCLAKADENGFLRGRLRTALRDRAAASTPVAAPVSSPPPPEESPRAPAHDDWYLRQGRFSRGPLYDGPWGMELDEVTRWLDSVPMSGVIVELAAGTGWWSTLLAEKGELWIYDSDGAALDAARKRLMAHGLLAHIHQRDPATAADKQVDAVVASYFLGTAATAALLSDRVATLRGWLKPGGTLVLIEAQAQAGVSEEHIEGPAGAIWPRTVETLREALAAGGFAEPELKQTSSAFVMGRAATAA
jgi:hypothetical protein